MTLKLGYAMVNVSDMDRSVAFYRDLLGLTLRFQSPGWSEFETGTTTLALHGGAERGAPVHGPQPAGTCNLGFPADDLDALHAELSKRGVRFVMPPTDRPDEGIKLAVAVDPDGLPIAFSQRR